MTESAKICTAAQSGRRKNQSGAWKSALLASGLGTVLLGAVWLAKIDPPATGQATTAQSGGAVAQASSAPSRSLPSVRSSSRGTGSSQTLNVVPSLPQRPVFQRPITRTRRS